MDIVSILTGAFGITLIKIIWDAIRYFLNRRDRLNNISTKMLNEKKLYREKIQKILLYAIEIQDLLDAYVEKHNNIVQRIIVLKITNGGDQLQLGTDQYMTILFESVRDQKFATKEKYTKNIIDTAHKKLLAKAFATPNENFLVPINDKYLNYISNSHLKNFYIVYNIKLVIIQYVVSIPPLHNDNNDNGFIIYLVVHIDSDITNDNVLNAIKLDTDVIKEKIRQLFVNFYLK